MANPIGMVSRGLASTAGLVLGSILAACSSGGIGAGAPATNDAIDGAAGSLDDATGISDDASGSTSPPDSSIAADSTDPFGAGVSQAADAGVVTAGSAAKLGPYTVQTYTLAQSLIPSGSTFCCDTKTAPISPQGSTPRAVPEIFYPANGPGNYPGIVFIPGDDSDFASDPWTGTGVNGATSVLSNIPDWGRFLASHGFVVMMTDPVTYGASAMQRSTALLQAISVLASENTRSGSPLSGMLNSKNLAVLGHSYGAAGALYAAGGTDARIKAALGLSPVGSSPYFTGDQVPSGIICAQNDPYMSDSGYQSEYASIPAAHKFIAQFLFNKQLDSGHSIGLNPLGSHTTDPYVARYGLSFFEVYLMGDQRYEPFLVTNSLMDSFRYSP